MAAISHTIFCDAYLWMKICILIKISLNFVHNGQIDNKLALVKITAWRQIGDKPIYHPRLSRITEAYIRQQGEVNLKASHANCHSTIVYLFKSLVLQLIYISQNAKMPKLWIQVTVYFNYISRVAVTKIFSYACTWYEQNQLRSKYPRGATKVTASCIMRKY